MGGELKHQFRVGVFVAIGVIIVLASLYILSGNKTGFTPMAKLHTHLENVQGLAPGSLVSLSGMHVGIISKIEFLPNENAMNVTLDIEERFMARIYEKSFVDVRTQGALGDKFLFITPGQPSAKTLKSGDYIETTKAQDIFGVIAERSSEATKIFDIISELHKVVKSMNDNNRTEKIFSNLAETSIELRKLATDSQVLVPKAASTLDKLDRIATKIDQGDGTLGALINDSSIHDQIKSMVGGNSKKKTLKYLLRGSLQNESEQPDGK